MKTMSKNILELAKPYLNTRKNDVHTEISIQYAFKLLEKEDGNVEVVIPAIILHDVGWIKIPEELQLNAFGPTATSPQLNRVHEEEGVKIAREILQRVKYDKDTIQVILDIIDGHDSRKTAVSLNDKIVKDADKLWRYSKKKGFQIDVTRFKETPQEGIQRIASNIDRWFFTSTAKEIARRKAALEL